jgi:hypothetical protein
MKRYAHNELYTYCVVPITSLQNISFCSLTCQANEASKPVYSSEKGTSSLFVLVNSPRSKIKSSPPYKLSYHRRLSFSYSPSSSPNTTLPVYYFPLHSSSSTSTISSTASSSSASSAHYQPSHYQNTKQNHSSFFNNIQQNVYTNYF